MYCLQDGLRRRMDKLKSSIEEANLAVDKEREKNVSLLHMIFPPNIAKRLWLGKCCMFCKLILLTSQLYFIFKSYRLFLNTKCNTDE